MKVEEALTWARSWDEYPWVIPLENGGDLEHATLVAITLGKELDRIRGENPQDSGGDGIAHEH